MIRNCIIIAVFSIISMNIYSEEFKASINYLGLSIKQHDAGELNGILEENAIEKFEENNFTVFMSDIDYKDKFVFGKELKYSFSDSNEYGDYKATASTECQLFADMGYVIFGSSKAVKIYPKLGIGLSCQELVFSKKDDLTFEEAVSSPEREITLYKNSVLLDLGVGVDYFIETDFFRKIEKLIKIDGLTIGMRAGYQIDISPDIMDLGKWKAHGIDISGGPDDWVDGAYISLTTGIFKY